jgi:hypothetical protein
VDLDKVELLWLQVSAECGCGEPLARGEQVGFEPTTKELLCLRCLADLTAGRPRPRRRAPRPGTTGIVGGLPLSASAPLPQPERYAPPTAHQAPTPPSMPRDPWSDPDGVVPFRSEGFPPRRPRRNGPGRASGLVVALLLVALAVVGIPRLLARSSPVDGTGASARSPLGDIAMGAPISPSAPSDPGFAVPPVPSDARTTRLSASPTQRSSSTAYTFLATTSSGRPVGFDPCRPIHLVVNTDEAPRGGNELIKEAAAEVSAATGLVLSVDGRTTETPTLSRRSVDKGRYGNRWAPVLVAWTHDSANSLLAGRVVGIGGPALAPYRDPADMHYVTGGVLLDAPAFERILDEPGGRVLARSIVMHELGHLVGLGHVADQRELMFASMVGQTGFGDGDLEGLRRLGSGPCFSS